MKIKILSVFITAALALMMAACGSKGNVMSQQNGNGNPQSSAAVAEITEQEALEAALAHANISKADAKYTKSELDFDDGVKHYDVEFTAGGYEYDYDVDAQTGKILKSEKDIAD